MRIPSIDQLENSVFKKPVNPRAASIFFGAFLDVGVEPTLAGKAASALAHLYVDGLEFVRTVASDRGANALLYDDDFREDLKSRLVTLDALSSDLPTFASQIMDLLERRSGEPEDRARVRTWVDMLRRLATQCHVESILDVPGETGIEGSPFGAGAVGRVFRSLVILVGLVEFLDDEELPAGLSAVALADIFRETANRMRPAIVGDGRTWQGLVGFLNDFTSGGSLPPQ